MILTLIYFISLSTVLNMLICHFIFNFVTDLFFYAVYCIVNLCVVPYCPVLIDLSVLYLYIKLI